MLSHAESLQADASVAQLSSRGRYTLFSHAGTRLMFIAPAPLERYLEVTEWDAGYLVVQTKYAVREEPIEEYIDLVPILRNLYLDPEDWCKGIDRVEVSYV